MSGWIKSVWHRLEDQRWHKFKCFETDLSMLVNNDVGIIRDTDPETIERLFGNLKDRSENIPKTAILMGIDYPIERHAVVFLCADKSFSVHGPGDVVPIEPIVMKSK
jgi:hypothetical protein